MSWLSGSWGVLIAKKKVCLRHNKKNPIKITFDACKHFNLAFFNTP
jgi:hypothetical protein